MSEYKGTGILFLRQHARTLNRVDAVLELLSEDDRRTFTETMAGTWVPMAFADRAWNAAARGIFPERNVDAALRELGRLLAHDNLKGVYAFLARITSFHFILKNAATLHRTYHRVGEASVVRGNNGEDIIFVISNYDHLPQDFRTAMCGWCDGAAEVCKERIHFTVERTAQGWTFSGARQGTA